MGENKKKAKQPAEFANSTEWLDASNYYEKYKESQQSYKKRNWKRIFISIITISLLLVFLVTGWLYLDKISSAEHAVNQEDPEKLADLISFPHDSQSFNASQANHMIDYYKKHPGEFVSTVGYLRTSSGTSEEIESEHFLHIKDFGKKWLVFDHYAIELDAAKAEVQSDINEVSLYLNGEEVGKLSNGIYAINGLTPGEHVLKGEVHRGDKVYDEVVSLNTYQTSNEPITLEFEEFSTESQEEVLSDNLESDLKQAVQEHVEEYIAAFEAKDMGEFKRMKNESYLERTDETIQEMTDLGQNYDGKVMGIGYDIGSLDFSYDEDSKLYNAAFTVSFTFDSGYYLDGDGLENSLRTENTYYWNYEFTYDEAEQNWFITGGTPLSGYTTDELDIREF
ncbi:hypothetical protein [Halobacillus sp. Marseille-Q1614]|uniref:TcaA second domain-containing protein n=1 Tax=Halobacillus sp. Marseille-Q1614 TaxID=2709134 RepID=UPI00156F889D|nr:hypothetical protein [Halobacillus sp. Marseille-Q1614]